MGKIKHSRRYTPEYVAWEHMKQRCNNKKHPAFHHYGGRGITVCERWANSFENFFDDMGERPSPKHSLDRYPNNDGNYEPSNCRWATDKEQVNNRRLTTPITFKGETLPPSGWAKKFGINAETVRRRHKMGVDISLIANSGNRFYDNGDVAVREAHEKIKEKKLLAKRLRSEGLTYKQIMEKLGLKSVGNVDHYLKH